jgi:hypothetical protein
MQIVAAIIAALAAASKALLDWWKACLPDSAEHRAIRNSIRSEMAAAIISLNFFVCDALDPELSEKDLLRKHFPHPLRMRSIPSPGSDKLPEARELKNWADGLASIGGSGHAPLFEVLMLLQGLALPPLNKYLRRDSRAFVNRILKRPDAEEYRLNCLQHGGRYIKGNRSARNS